MKKILFTIIGIMICGVCLAAPISVTSYVSPNDVTITNLENNQNTIVNAINSFDGNLIQTGTISAGALENNAQPGQRWGRAFNDWVYTGLLPPTTSGTLTSTTTSGEAFISDDSANNQYFVEKDATAHTYSATKWTYVDLNFNGTYTYVETSIGTAEPGTTADSIRLARVSTDATEVTSVRDDRPLSIQLDNAEDQYIVGFNVTTVSPDALTVQPGVVYNGTTRIAKTSDTSLSLGTADDWATGISGRATSTKGFVVINDTGSIKLTTTAPTTTDTSGNSNGELRYSYINSDYWRVIHQFYMNAQGSGDTSDEAASAWVDTLRKGQQIQMTSTVTGVYDAGANANVPNDTTTPQTSEVNEFTNLRTTITPTTTDSKLIIDVAVCVEPKFTGTGVIALFKDTDSDVLCVVPRKFTDDDTEVISFSYSMASGTTSEITFKVGAAQVGGAGTLQLNSFGDATKFNETMTSSVVVRETKP